MFKIKVLSTALLANYAVAGDLSDAYLTFAQIVKKKGFCLKNAL
jgi:hypothetical protein